MRLLLKISLGDRRSFNKTVFIVILSMLFLTSTLKAEENSSYTIEELINLAGEKNPSYQSVKKNVEAEQYELSIIKKYPNPDLEFGLGYGLSENENGIEYSTSLSQPIVLGRQKKYRIEKAKDKIKIAEYTRNWEKQILDFKIKKDFYTILYLGKKLDLYKKNINSLKKMLSLIEKQRSSIHAELTMARIKTELLRTENKKKDITISLKHLQVSLNNLAGGSLEENYEISGEFRFFSDDYTFEYFVKQAKIKNSFLLKRQHQLKLKETDVFLEKANRIPGIKASISYNNEIDKKAFGVGLSFPIPIWNNNSAKILKAVSLKQKAEWQKESYEKKMISYLKEAYERKNTLSEKKKTYEDLLKQSGKVVNLAELLFQQGKVDLFGLLDSKRDYLKDQKEYYQTLFELATTSIELEKLSGIELP